MKNNLDLDRLRRGHWLAALIGQWRAGLRNKRVVREALARRRVYHMVAVIVGKTSGGKITYDSHLWELWESGEGKRKVEFTRITGYPSSYDPKDGSDHPCIGSIKKWKGGLLDSFLKEDGTYWFRYNQRSKTR